MDPIITTIAGIGTSVIIGAGVGYITNDLALKWMFSGLGSLPPRIAANKEGLGNSLGKTVSDRLLPSNEEDDEKILLKKLRDKDVEDALRFAVDDWLKHHLPSAFDDLRLNEIEGFDQTVSNLNRLITDFLHQNAASILDTIASGIDLATLLPDSQQNYILDHLVSILSEEIDRSALDQYINNLLQENDDSCLADILGSQSDSICFQLSRECSKRIIQDICDHPSELSKALRPVAIESAVYETISSVAEKPLSSLFGNQTIEDFVNQNRDVIRRIISSEEFRNILTSLIKEILRLLRDINISLYQIFPINEQNKLSTYISNKLPDIMPYLLDYLSEKKTDITNLVDDAVDSVIDSGTSNPFANGIRKLCRELILKEIKKIDIIQKLEELADAFLHSADAVKQCREMLEQFLKKTTVADVVALLDKHGALSTDMLAEALLDLINQYIDRVPKEIYQMAGNFRLSTVVDVRALPLSAWKEQFCQWLILQLKYSPAVQQKFEVLLSSALYDKASDMLHLPLSKLLTPEIRVELLRATNGSRFASWINTNRFGLVKKIKAFIQPLIHEKKLSGILPRSKIMQLADTATQKVVSAFHSGVMSIQDTKIGQFAKKLAHSPVSKEISSFLQGALIPALKQNCLAAKKTMTEIISGRIIGLDTKDIGEMMSKFMGKEMRPLCKLGAVIGAFVGFGMGLWDPFFGSMQVSSFLIRLAVFALIGVVTNFLAFRGLFRPYDPKGGIVGCIWKQGYIPAHKKNVAQQFGVFVEKEMLNGDTIGTWFQNQSEELQETIPQSLLKNDCAGLRRMLQENHASISSYISESLQSKLEQENENISNTLLQEFGEMKLNDIIPSSITADASARIIHYFRYHPEEINDAFLQALRTNCSLSSTAPAINQMLQEQINSMTSPLLKNVVEPYLSYESLWRLADENDYYQKHKHKTVYDVASNLTKSDPFPQLSEKLAGFLVDKLFSDQGSGFICDKLTDLLSHEFDEGKTVRTVFDGQLYRFLDGSIAFLTKQIVSNVLENLQKEKRSIQNSLINEVHRQTNSVERFLVDADNLVKNIVSRLIDRNLSKFFKTEISDLSFILKNFFESEIYPIRISSIQLDVRNIDFKFVIRGALNNQTAKKYILSSAKELSFCILKALADQKIETFADVLHIKHLTDVIERFEQQTKLLLDHLRSLICDNRNTAKVVSNYAYGIVDRSVMQCPISDFVGSVDEADLQSAIQNTVQFVLGQPALCQYLQVLMDNLYSSHQNDDVSAYYEPSIAQSSIQMILMDKSLLLPLVTEECDLAVRFFISDHFACIVPATREQIMKHLVSSGLNTISSHLLSLLDTIKIDRVVEQIVLDMDGKSIHDMFNEFARPYFNQLIAAGAAGGVIVAVEFLAVSLSSKSLLAVDFWLSIIIVFSYIYKICSTKQQVQDNSRS